jgi:hypothetical protein
MMACCPVLLFGQATLNVLDLHYDYSIPPKGKTIEAKADVENFNFHILTGGISFETVAKPAAGLEKKKISLDYNDGQFTVTIGGQVYDPQLPDWQLIPVVKFVNSPYQVAFSSLGDTVGNNQARLLYHPAFRNTLLGLRIFEADVLNIPGVLWDLPRDNNKQYLLAQSEGNYIPQKDSVLNLKLYDELCGEGRPFSSFVITDKKADIIFDVQNGKLLFEGHPYYLFTKNKINRKEIKELQKRIEQYYRDIEENAKIFLGDSYTSDLNPRENMAALSKQLEQKESKDKIKFNPFPYQRLKADIAELDSLQTKSLKELSMAFKILDGFTASFNKNWEMLKQYNPVVYPTLENVSRWSAFFRYVKQTNPDNWEIFLRKVSDKRPTDAPTVKTPTSFEIDYIRIFTDKVKKQEIF